MVSFFFSCVYFFFLPSPLRTTELAPEWRNKVVSTATRKRLTDSRWCQASARTSTQKRQLPLRSSRSRVFLLGGMRERGGGVGGELRGGVRESRSAVLLVYFPRERKRKRTSFWLSARHLLSSFFLFLFFFLPNASLCEHSILGRARRDYVTGGER